MSNINIIPFEFESNRIRTVVDEDNTILFVAKDIAEALGYENSSKAINDHCKGVTKRYPIVDSLGRTQKVRVILESDVYRLMVKSKLPSAEKFERWVFEEVLPTLRKTGSYSIKPQKLPSATTIMRFHKHLEVLAKQAGLKDNQLLLKVNRGVTKITGVDQLEVMDIKHLLSPDNDEYLTPTAIGELLNPVIKAKALNSWMTYLGLQISKHTGKGYIPTPKGEELGGKMCDVPLQHVEGSTQSLKWNPKVIIPYLQKLIGNHQTH
ncbi:prophage antirepressor [Candidatus Liberibacter solanacearum CLso-ZC1]|uniref:Prophage antirepressor n=1 Tax=Liberibacter solanacearum (strain CLso-ZC1) TaxID=658172 RepID=E4UEA6_LIBSC|nr:phage repressor protein [Candidatus Liberibacter solanacearum]ADR52934.1 prophage antirepressor [Candidatus Liberibacter solanacearum CLso-ZC1]